MTVAPRHVLGLALLTIALALPAAQQDSDRLEREKRRNEQQQRAVVESLQRVSKQLERDAANLSRQERELRAAEKSVASALAELRRLQEQRAERAAARKALQDERTAREADRKRHQQQLADQLRGAYFMGRNEPLQLLLNQRSTTQISRMMTYYGYFGRLRAQQIDQLNEDVARIEELTARIEEEDAELATLEQRQKAQVGELDSARQQRHKVLASTEKDARTHGAEKAQLEKQQKELKARLDDLLRQLARATESAPYDPRAPFAQQRNRLNWPVAGRIAVDYGAPLFGGSTRSTAIEIEARQGAEVRAVHEGRVEVADYMSGRGLIVVLNHGNGFVSIYGHNDELFRQVGERVKAGDLIATVGDSGGRKSPGLYFEIRSGYRDGSAGKPVNPHDWVRTSAPPTR
jgi:septal ring factor EnvC (AmiA/AmiB activator)